MQEIARLDNTQSKPNFSVTTCKPTGLRSSELENIASTVTNDNNLITYL